MDADLRRLRRVLGLLQLRAELLQLRLLLLQLHGPDIEDGSDGEETEASGAEMKSEAERTRQKTGHEETTTQRGRERMPSSPAPPHSSTASSSLPPPPTAPFSPPPTAHARTRHESSNGDQRPLASPTALGRTRTVVANAHAAHVLQPTPHLRERARGREEEGREAKGGRRGRTSALVALLSHSACLRPARNHAHVSVAAGNVAPLSPETPTLPTQTSDTCRTASINGSTASIHGSRARKRAGGWDDTCSKPGVLLLGCFQLLR
eukprot:590837-Rhodomonas_salina.2